MRPPLAVGGGFGAFSGAGACRDDAGALAGAAVVRAWFERQPKNASAAMATTAATHTSAPGPEEDFAPIDQISFHDSVCAVGRLAL
jgi:hypothetical protein